MIKDRTYKSINKERLSEAGKDLFENLVDRLKSSENSENIFRREYESLTSRKEDSEYKLILDELTDYSMARNTKKMIDYASRGDIFSAMICLDKNLRLQQLQKIKPIYD